MKRLLILLCLWPTVGQAATFRVLSIGLNAPADTSWKPLQWAESDAKKMGEALGTGTKFTRKVSTILGSAATRVTVRQALQSLLRESLPEDVVVIYISSHGSLAANAYGGLDPELVLFDTKLDQLAATGLAQNEVRDILNKVRAKRKLFIMASCHSGLGKSQLPADVEKQLQRHKGPVTWRALEDASEGFMVFAAAARGETALEDDKLKGDVYTSFFLKGLESNDRNHDGAVSALEAHDFAKELTYQYSKGRQRPTVEAAVIGDGDFALRGTRTGEASPILEAYGSQWDGMRVTVNERSKGRLPLAFPLEVGDNIVVVETKTDEDKIMKARFLVSAGEEEQVSFADLWKEPPFEVGAHILQRTWYDSRLAKIIGKKSTLGTSLTLAYRWTWVRAGLVLDSDQPATSEPLGDIKVTAHSQFLGVQVGPRYHGQGPWELGVNMNATTGTVRLKVEDRASGLTTEKKITPAGYGYDIYLAWDFAARWQMQLQYRESFSKWDFDSSGSVPARNSAVMVGGAFLWGGNSTRLWP